jgi:hypothetical protein
MVARGVCVVDRTTVGDSAIIARVGDRVAVAGSGVVVGAGGGVSLAVGAVDGVMLAVGDSVWVGVLVSNCTTTSGSSSGSRSKGAAKLIK